MIKCPVCNKEVIEEEAVYNTKTKRYYHEDCYQSLLDRKKLCDYICEVYDLRKPNNKMYQQMTSYYESGISYKDMLACLKYFYEIKNGDVAKSGNGIGIIPYILKETKEFISLEEIEKNKLIETFKKSNIIKEQNKTVILKNLKSNSSKKQIDINII